MRAAKNTPGARALPCSQEAASALAAFFAQAQQGRPRQQQLLGGEDDDEYGEELVEDEEADLGGEDEEDQEQQGQEAAPHGRGPRGGRRPAPQRGARGGGRYGASSSTAGERRERNRLAARKCRAKRWAPSRAICVRLASCVLLSYADMHVWVR